MCSSRSWIFVRTSWGIGVDFDLDLIFFIVFLEIFTGLMLPIHVEQYWLRPHGLSSDRSNFSRHLVHRLTTPPEYGPGNKEVRPNQNVPLTSFLQANYIQHIGPKKTDANLLLKDRFE